MVDLFESRGPRGGTPPTDWCWCMWWRDRSHDREKNKSAMSQIVRKGPPPGLLAYDGDRPVGWVSVAPRGGHGQLLRSRTLKPEDAEEHDVYSITCFYVDPSAKRKGVSRALLSAAVEYARSEGAKVVEGYPSDTATGFMGARSSFEDCGFSPDRKAGSRTVFRYQI